MRKLLLVVLILLFICGLASKGLLATGTGGNTPKSVIPEPIYLFNAAMEDEYVVHGFLVQNKGTAELAITKAKSG